MPIAGSRITRARIVAAARGWLGTPYVHQASAKGAGADCLGLVRGLYTELLGREPETPPPYTPDWNERRPSEEPLLNAARRHLAEAGSPLPRRFAGELSAKLTEGARSIRGGGMRGESTPPQSLRDSSPVDGGAEARMLLPGQVLIFRIVTTGPAKHCGVVSSHDQFIHAYAGRCVVESWLCRWWIERIAGVFEFPGVEG